MSAGHAYLCLVIGIICGWSTAAKFGGAYSVAADVVFGVLGALLGGIALRVVGGATSFAGMKGTVCGALAGAVLFLVALRVVRRLESR